MPPLPPLPPLQYVLDALAQNVLPPAGAAALVVCTFLVLGRWAGALWSAVAVVVGFMVANFTLAFVKPEDVPTWENTFRLLPWKPEETAAGWNWLPRAALLLLAVGLLSRWVGLLAAHYLPERRWWVANVMVWTPRVAAVVVVSEWLVSGRAAQAEEWQGLRWQLAAVTLAAWVTLDAVARAGMGGQVAAYLAAMLLVGGAVLLYAHSKRFMDVAVILGSVMFGVAVAAGSGKADASGAVPAGVAFLPGLVLGGRPSLAEHAVPATAFWLVALAPLVLLPFLVPTLSRKNGWIVRIIRALAVFAPLIAALILAAHHEKLAFEEEW